MLALVLTVRGVVGDGKVVDDTGKVVDTVFMTSSCPGCKAMEDKHAQGAISKYLFRLVHKTRARL